MRLTVEAATRSREAFRRWFGRRDLTTQQALEGFRKDPDRVDPNDYTFRFMPEIGYLADPNGFGPRQRFFEDGGADGSDE